MQTTELLNNIRFVVNVEGIPESVIIDIEAWNTLMQILDELREVEMLEGAPGQTEGRN